MKYIVTYDEHGNITNAMSTDDETLAHLISLGRQCLELPEMISNVDVDYYVDVADPDNHQLVKYSEAHAKERQNALITPGYDWHVKDKKVVDNRTLPLAKEQKWKDIKAKREVATQAAFTADGMIFDANPQMASYITSDEFIEWTLHNNSAAKLRMVDFQRVVEAQSVRNLELHARARAIRKLINAAVTVAEVDAINWHSVI